MAVVSVGNFKQRELPERVKEMLRQKLDDAIEMYEAGVPLWINTGLAWDYGKSRGKLDIYIKGWL